VTAAPGYHLEWIHRTILEPRWGSAGPNGEALVNGRQLEDKYTIYQIVDNLQLAEYASFPGLTIMSFEYDSAGNLWFATDAGALYKAAESGPPELVVGCLFPPCKPYHRVMLQIGREDDIYAIDATYGDEIRRVSPDGQVEVFADGFTELGKLILVGPNDEVVVHDEGAGQLIWAKEGGEKHVVIQGTPNFEGEFYGFFKPDGTLVVKAWFQGVNEVDLESGELTRIEWLDVIGSICCYYVIPPATLIAYDAWGILRIDLETREMETIFLPLGLTYAMAVGPDGHVYAAYGNLLPQNPTTFVYRLDPNDEMVPIGSVPGNATAMEFGPDGTGYVAAEGAWGVRYYRFDPETSVFAKYLESPPLDLGYSLAVDPTTGQLWWVGIDDGIAYLYTMNDDEQVERFSLPDGAHRAFPEIAPDGTVYVGINFYCEPEEPHPRRSYRLESDNSWTEVVDMTCRDLDSWGQFPAVCADGTLYMLGDIEAQIVDPSHSPDRGPIESVIRIDGEGSFTVLAHGGCDGSDIECDRQTGQIYFMSSEGFFRLTKLAFRVFLPLTVRNS
jgi:hypothetical protein